MDLLDQNSLTMMNQLYPEFRARVFRIFNDVYSQHGLKIKVTEGFRNFQRQKDLYDQGRSKPGKIVTHARPGETFHNYGLAVDCCFNVHGDPYLEKHPNGEFLWSEIGRFASLYGVRWGGSFKSLIDKPHLECIYSGVTTDWLHMIYEAGGITQVFKEIDKKLRG